MRFKFLEKANSKLENSVWRKSSLDIRFSPSFSTETRSMQNFKSGYNWSNCTDHNPNNFHCCQRVFSFVWRRGRRRLCHWIGYNGRRGWPRWRWGNTSWLRWAWSWCRWFRNIYLTHHVGITSFPTWAFNINTFRTGILTDDRTRISCTTKIGTLSRGKWRRWRNYNRITAVKSITFLPWRAIIINSIWAFVNTFLRISIASTTKVERLWQNRWDKRSMKK